ncbi:MAG: hypothetical protein HQM09_19180 [Candidatus Riflebacteria bacterium]|nr:hypothetical protein [Candidatus Riflebacteria bacterium]
MAFRNENYILKKGLKTGKKLIIVRFVLCFVLVISVFGISTAEAASWISYSPPAVGVKAALATLIDEDNVWMGYANFGVVRYNTEGFIQSTITPKEGLPGPTVTALAKRDKELWIGTSDGLALHSEGGSVRQFTAKEGLPDNGITCLCVHDNTVYAGTMKGLVLFRGDSFEVIGEDRGLPSIHITALSSSEKGVLIGTIKGWALMKGASIEAHTPVTDRLPFEWITSLAYFRYQVTGSGIGSDEFIVIGTAGGGLLYYRDGVYKTVRKEDAGPGSDWITDLKYDPENKQLWVATNDTGIAVEDIVSGKWVLHNTKNSDLVSDIVKCLSLRVVDCSVTDYEVLAGGGQECSCATCAALIHSAHPKPCPTCWKLPSPPHPRKLPRIQTWVSIATQEGCNMYFDKKLLHVGRSNIFCYLANKGWKCVGMGVGEKVWAGVHPPGALEGFLFYFEPPQIKYQYWSSNPPAGKFPGEIDTLSTDQNGYPIAGGHKVGMGGLAILNPDVDSWKIIGSESGLSDLTVTCMIRYGGALLIGTGGMGKNGSVYRLENSRCEELPRSGLTSASKNGMFPASVTSIAATAKRIYVGTLGDGLYVFDGDSWSHLETLRTKWLSSDDILSLAARNDAVYIGTKKGLDCWMGEATLHVDPQMTGAPSPNVTALLWDDSDGDGASLQLWVGCEGAITRYHRAQTSWTPPREKPRYGPAVCSFMWPTSDNSDGAVYCDAWAENPNYNVMVDVCPFDGLPGNKILGFATDDFNLWVATDNGICRLRK